jgi:ubiquinone/menaquinone biosynthesis C-methylase UbiE
VRRAGFAFYNDGLLQRFLRDNSEMLIGARVLEIGCGKGALSWELAQRGAKIYSVDISAELLSLAIHAEGEFPSPVFLLCDAHSLPFANRSFDYVVGNGVLHHLDIGRAFAEIARVLKPEGKAFFVEPMRHHPVLRVIRMLTPHSRTPDEKPLTFTDIAQAGNFFYKVTHSEHYLFSVLLGPLGFLSGRLQQRLVRVFSRLDNVIFRTLPWTRKFAWMTFISLER